MGNAHAKTQHVGSISTPGKKATIAATKPKSASKSFQSPSLFENITVTKNANDRNVWDFYAQVDNIAQGSTCEIYTVRKTTGTKKDPLFILKRIAKDQVDHVVKEMRNEIAILQKLDHPNVVRVYETFEDKRNVYLIMEYLKGGDLFSHEGYTEAQAAKILTKVCSAIAYCHKHKVVHRDIKLENIIFQEQDPNSECTVIDFGLSQVYVKSKGARMEHKVGTIYTMSPQVLKGSYTEKADMWAIGVVAYILLSGKRPFDGDTDKEIASKIYRGAYSMEGPSWEKVSTSAKQFVASLLEYEPGNRKSAVEALRSPWLQKTFPLDARRPDQSSLNKIQQKLIAAHKDSEFRKLAKMVIAYRMPICELHELRVAFDALDANNNGTISYWEFKNSLKDHKYTESELKKMFQGLDQGNNGEINYTEFLSATLETRGKIEMDQVLDAFDKLDINKSGMITPEEIREALGNSCSIHGSERIVNEILSNLDQDGDGEISREEFMTMFAEKYDRDVTAALCQMHSK